jgi:hypothetical protein
LKSPDGENISIYVRVGQITRSVMVKSFGFVWLNILVFWLVILIFYCFLGISGEETGDGRLEAGRAKKPLDVRREK